MKLEVEFSSGYGFALRERWKKIFERGNPFSLRPGEGRKEEKKMKFPAAPKLRRAGKKVSNCSRTLANSIKICSARRSSDILGKLRVSVTRFSPAAFRKHRERKKKLFPEDGNYECWVAARAACQLQPLPTRSQPHLQPLKWRCFCTPA